VKSNSNQPTDKQTNEKYRCVSTTWYGLMVVVILFVWTTVATFVKDLAAQMLDSQLDQGTWFNNANTLWLASALNVSGLTEILGMAPRTGALTLQRAMKENLKLEAEVQVALHVSMYYNLTLCSDRSFLILLSEISIFSVRDWDTLWRRYKSSNVQY
jgi:hypothetical protein